MEDFLIPDVDGAVIARLEARAARAGKSLEQLVCEILTEAAKPGPVADSVEIGCCHCEQSEAIQEQ
jgi:plasmid stability protein